MNYKTMLSIGALAILMAVPFSASAQNRGRDSGHDSGRTSDHARGDSGRSSNSHDRSSDRRSNSDRISPDRRDSSARGGDTHRDTNRNWDRSSVTNDSRRESDRVTNRSDSRRFDDTRRDNRFYSGRDRGDNFRRDEHVSFHDTWHRGGFTEFCGNRHDFSDIALFAGFVGLVGVLEHDDFLCFAGAFGEFYAISQYEADYGCDDPYLHARACYFDLPFFYRDGCRYERTVVFHDGVRGYRFVRCH